MIVCSSGSDAGSSAAVADGDNDDDAFAPMFAMFVTLPVSWSEKEEEEDLPAEDDVRDQGKTAATGWVMGSKEKDGEDGEDEGGRTIKEGDEKGEDEDEEEEERKGSKQGGAVKERGW